MSNRIPWGSVAGSRAGLSGLLYILVNPRRSRPENFLSRVPTLRPPPRRQVKPTSFPAHMLARILVAANFQTFQKAFLPRVFAF
ncbi:hypothetical protein CCHR01_16296 [Colletotrichum chrysophilum]|uniref:Uncharacterized protein n=1 Tax=Colletotrichum chrysophilum TaxID=1836956 RepID=A0AAD9EAL4_9PEZI|nr:hypothetical protein CCHR01_16296 [Colletotrichum chrysophilum]